MLKGQIIEQIAERIRQVGFQETAYERESCRLFLNEREGRLYAVLLVDNRPHWLEDPWQLEAILRQTKEVVERSLHQQGTDASSDGTCRILGLLVTNQLETDKMKMEGILPKWLLTEEGGFYIFEGQPSRFMGLERILGQLKLEQQARNAGRGAFAGETYRESNGQGWLQKMRNGSFPWVTLVFFAVNVLVQILVTVQEAVFGTSAINAWMVLPVWSLGQSGEYWRVLTCGFLHFGWQHLINNMLALLALGPIVENYAKHAPFAAAYLLCTAGSGLLSYWCYLWNQELLVATAGASGAVFGVVGMLLVFVAANRGSLQGISIQRVLLMILFTLGAGISSAGINNWGHIFGLVLGILCGLVIEGKNRMAASRKR